MERKQTSKTVAFAETVEQAQGLLAVAVNHAHSIRNFSLKNCEWLKGLLRDAGESIALCDEDAAIESLGKANVGVIGLIVKYLKGSVEHYESKFDSARVHFLAEMDITIANSPDWTPDRSFDNIQKFWNKRIAALKAAPFELKDNIGEWIKLHNAMEDNVEVVIRDFKGLIQSRYSAASRTRQDAHKAKLAKRIADREAKEAAKEAAKQAARTNPEIVKDIREVQNGLLGMLDRPQAPVSAMKSA